MQNRRLLVALFAFLVFVIGWATRFQYITFKDGDTTYPVRINRYTGHTQMFTGDYWTETK
jgi:hypothetical protein